MTPVQMLWIEGDLSTLERLSVASFLRNGHPVDLYSYGAPGNVPQGASVRDARDILPESALFRKKGAAGYDSWTPFSNLFRYKLLHERGGIWCDADLVCIKPLDFDARMQYFFSTERVHPATPGAAGAKVKVNCTAIKAPQGSALMKEALERASAIDAHTAQWSATGGIVLGELALSHGLGDALLQPAVFCPVDFWRFTDLIAGMTTLPEQCYAVHFWNEMWRRNFFDKNAGYEPLCLYERLKAHFL